MAILGWTMGWCVPQWLRRSQGLLLASAVGPARRHRVLLWVGVTRFLDFSLDATPALLRWICHKVTGRGLRLDYE